MTPTLYIAFVCALSLLMLLMAYEVKPGDRRLVDAYFRACRNGGYQWKEIAAFQGLHESQLKRQFNAEPGQHVSAYRMGAAPIDVLRGFAVELAPSIGLRVVSDDDHVIPLIDSTRTLVESNRELLNALGDWRRLANRGLFLGEKEIA